MSEQLEVLCQTEHFLSLQKFTEKVGGRVAGSCSPPCGNNWKVKVGDWWGCCWAGLLGRTSSGVGCALLLLGKTSHGEGHGNPLQCSCLENPGMGEPGGLPSMGSHRVRHTEVTQKQPWSSISQPLCLKHGCSQESFIPLAVNWRLAIGTYSEVRLVYCNIGTPADLIISCPTPFPELDFPQVQTFCV